VVVVGERSGHATLYRVVSDGSLQAVDRVATGEGPNWVRFV
jgi:6-phosphogluconolactonase